MKFLRFGGANHVRQDNKRAPEGRGIWCFPLGLVDIFYLGGTDKFERRTVRGEKKIVPAPARIFTYKGEVWVGIEDVPERLLHKALAFRKRGEKEWVLLDYATLKKVVSIKKRYHHRNSSALLGPQKTGKRQVVVQKTIRLSKSKWVVYFNVVVTCPVHGDKTGKTAKKAIPHGIYDMGEKAIEEYILFDGYQEALEVPPSMCPECAAKINAGMECFIPGVD